MAPVKGAEGEEDLPRGAVSMAGAATPSHGALPRAQPELQELPAGHAA